MGAEFVIVAAVLLIAMAGRGSAPVVASSSGSGAPAGGAPDTGKITGAIAGGVSGVLGLLGSGGAVTATGGVTAGTTATVGTVAGGTTAGGTSATLAAGGTALVGGSSVAGGFVLVGVVVLFIIADQVNKALQTAKDFQGALLNTNINARSLHEFEADCVRAFLRARGRTWTEESVRDFRLDRYVSGQKVVAQGWRSVLRTLPVAEDVADLGRIRLMAREFVRWRSVFGYRLIRAWGIPANPPADWGWSSDLLQSVYESQLPNVGNLLGVPHAYNGATIQPRVDPSAVLPSEWELVGTAGEINYPTKVSLTEAELRAARGAALIDALFALRWDTRGIAEADPALYARMVVDALQWNGNTVAGLELRGESLWLDPAGEHSMGKAVAIYPAKIRAGSGGGVVEG